MLHPSSNLSGRTVNGFAQVLKDCQLSGSLPTQLGTLTALTYQSLANINSLSGSLPTQLAQFCPEHGVSPRACLVLDCSVDATNNYRCALDALGWAPAPPPPPPPSPHKPPLPPPLSPEATEVGEAQSQWVVWAAALLPLCMLPVAALALLYRRYSHSLRNAANLRVSRDRANFDLKLLAHQQQTSIIHLMQPPNADDFVSLPDGPPFTANRSTTKSGQSHSDCQSDGTGSELGKTFFPHGETTLTLSEVPGAAKLAYGRVFRPHLARDAASSTSSSKGTDVTEADIHLCCIEDIKQRYNLPFDIAAVATYAPIPQFGPFLEALSEAARAELLVSVGRDGRLMYANTGEPVVPRSGNSCTYLFVMLPSAGIYVRAETPLVFHHDLADNAPVVAAGEIFFSDGRLLSINNRSGHYRPPPECLRVVLSLLQSKGAQTTVPFKEFHYAARGTRVARPDTGV